MDGCSLLNLRMDVVLFLVTSVLIGKVENSNRSFKIFFFLHKRAMRDY